MIPTFPLHSDAALTLKTWRDLLKGAFDSVLPNPGFRSWTPNLSTDNLMTLSSPSIKNAWYFPLDQVIIASARLSFVVGGTPQTSGLMSLPIKAARGQIGQIFTVGGKLTGSSPEIVIGEILSNRESIRVTAGSAWAAGTREISFDLVYLRGA